MWVADMDFRPPPAVNAALAAAAAHGVHGYFGDEGDYRASITGWMARRHGWEVDPDAIFTVHGIVTASRSASGVQRARRRVILFTPVYHAFHRILAPTTARSCRPRWSSATGATSWTSTRSPGR